MSVYLKNFFSESVRGDEAEIWNIVHAYDNSLYIVCVLLPMSNCFRCFGNLKFSEAYNGNSGNLFCLIGDIFVLFS